MVVVVVVLTIIMKLPGLLSVYVTYLSWSNLGSLINVGLVVELIISSNCFGYITLHESILSRHTR